MSPGGVPGLSQPSLLVALKGWCAGSPIAVVWWAGNRFIANVWMVVVWQRIRRAPDRLRRFVFWLVVVNAASLVTFFWLLPLFRRS